MSLLVFTDRKQFMKEQEHPREPPPSFIFRTWSNSFVFTDFELQAKDIKFELRFVGKVKGQTVGFYEETR